MTMSFAEQIRAAVTTAKGVVDTESSQRFRAVLDELVVGLRDLGVGARIQPGRDARKLSLYLHPAHRPSRGNLMLTFLLDGERIMMSGEKPTWLYSPDELQGALLRYVQLPAFLESLDTLREQAALPVEARLRVDRQESHVLGDIVVAVSPEDQARLDATPQGSNVELAVERIDFPGNGSYKHDTAYLLLESAGLFVDVERVEPAGDKLLVKGKRA